MNAIGFDRHLLNDLHHFKRPLCEKYLNRTDLEVERCCRTSLERFLPFVLYSKRFNKIKKYNRSA